MGENDLVALMLNAIDELQTARENPENRKQEDDIFDELIAIRNEVVLLYCP